MTTVQFKSINAEIPPPDMLEIEGSYHHAFDRFNHFIREAQVTFRDTNGPKGGVDKLCTIQLRFYPRGLAVVKGDGTSFLHAANAACEKMQQVVAKRLGKKKSGPTKNSQMILEGELSYGN